MEISGAHSAVNAQLQEQQEIRQLVSRDREVRQHEQAHAAAGGRYAGSPHYETTRGPNGVSYATSGHVSIDVSEIEGNPQATLEKMLVVQRAALAPAQPSSQDRAVASEAAAKAIEARAELLRERSNADTQNVNPEISAYQSAESAQGDEGNTDRLDRGTFLNLFA